MNIDNILNKKVNFLTILGVGKNSRHVFAICECGVTKEYMVYNILNGHTKSCGCLSPKTSSETHTTHGLTKHPLYGVWSDMKRRCENKKRKAYKHYGGRGITVCDEWRVSFISFYNWAIMSGWEKGLQVDRVNNDGNYEPSNCRIATYLVNANNKRSNNIISYNGEKKTLAQFARLYKINQLALHSRIKNGWDLHDALNYPVKKKGGINRYTRSIRHTFGFIT